MTYKNNPRNWRRLKPSEIVKEGDLYVWKDEQDKDSIRISLRFRDFAVGTIGTRAEDSTEFNFYRLRKQRKTKPL